MICRIKHRLQNCISKRRIKYEIKSHHLKIFNLKRGNISHLSFYSTTVPEVEYISTQENNIDQNSNFEPLNYGCTCVLIDKKNDNKWIVKLQENEALSTHLGQIPHNQIKEAGYGGALILPNKKRIDIRRLTFEEYVVNLKRNVTPVYPKDMGRIITLLDVQPGNKILEAGTGSGSMTLYLARSVGAEGEVWSYDLREEFHETAKELINQWPLEAKSIKLNCASVDTCEAGEQYFDGIFLDLLNPEQVLGKLQHLVKDGKPVVLLLLHITQVFDLIKYINENNLNFQVEKTVEVAERLWYIDPPKCRPQSFGSSRHSGFLVQLIKSNKIIEL